MYGGMRFQHLNIGEIWCRGVAKNYNGFGNTSGDKALT